MPDGKRLIDVTQLEALRVKYVDSKLDPAVLSEVSEVQMTFFLYPHRIDILDIKPETKKQNGEKTEDND